MLSSLLAVDLLTKVGAVSDDGVYTFSSPQTSNTTGVDWDVISNVSSTELAFIVTIDSQYIGSVVEIVNHDSENQLSLSIAKPESRQTRHNSRKLILKIGDDAEPTAEFEYTPTSDTFQTLSLALSSGNTLMFFVDRRPSGILSVSIPEKLTVGVTNGLVLFNSATSRNPAQVSLNQTTLSEASAKLTSI